MFTSVSMDFRCSSQTIPRSHDVVPLLRYLHHGPDTPLISQFQRFFPLSVFAVYLYCRKYWYMYIEFVLTYDHDG